MSVCSVSFCREHLVRSALGLLVAAACGAAVAQVDSAAAARSLLARGELAAALQLIETAVASSPGDARMRFFGGVVLMELGRDAQALDIFTRLNQAYPELPDPLNNIALLQARAGQLDSARQSLETALRNDPAHRTARINLGLVHLMLAAQAWSQALAAVPGDTALLQKLQRVQTLLAAPTR